MIDSRLGRIAALTLAMGVLAGCATQKPAEPQVPTEEQYVKSLSEADALATAGNVDGARAAYQKIADNHPTKADPWVRAAQLDFSQGRYSQAIVAAEETLKRDPSNRPAKSITAVGGLRLAVRSLEELRTDSALAGDARTDAMRLSAMLRDTLGETVLVPKAEEPKPAPRARPRARPAPKPAPAPEPKSGGTPFDALK